MPTENVAESLPPAVDTPPESFKTLLAEFTALENERREHEDRVKQIKERVEAIGPTLLDHFADLGMQNSKVGGLTVFIKTERYCSKRGDVTVQQVCDALRSCGLGYMVADGYNPSSLSAKVREWQDSDDPVELPPELSPLLNVGETFKLASRRA